MFLFSTFLGSFGGPSGFPGGGLGFGSSQPPQLSRPLGILQSNSNSMPSSAAVSGRNPLFNTRDNRGKIGESLSAFDPSEFPSLGSRENSSAPNPALARSNYGKKSSFLIYSFPLDFILNIDMYTVRGRSLTTLTKCCPLLTTYLPLVGISEGIPLLL